MTEIFQPVTFVWTDDGVMKPLRHFTRLCDKQFVIGLEYRLVVEQERSSSQHRRYFACLREAWRNLPEDLAPRFKSPDKLRKWILIKLCYANEQSYVYDTVTDAARFEEILRELDEDVVIVRKKRVMVRYTAMSQSVRSMDKKMFQESSEAVLDYAARMIGVSSGELYANADQAA